MAADAAALPATFPRPRLRVSFSDAAFVFFLLLVFVGLQPFATRDPVALAAGESGFGGAGDILRQLAYLVALSLIFAAALRQEGFRAALAMPAGLTILLLWCAASAIWAIAPEVVLRRAALEFVIVASVMTGTSVVGAERGLVLMRRVLAAVLVINWLSIPLVHNAVHLPGEIDPGLVGDWRGVFFHKNIAGGVSAITAILFFFEALNSRRILHWFLFVAALGFTIMTRSKSSLGLLPFGLAAGAIYRLAWRRGIDRAILCAAMLLAGIAAITLVSLDAAPLFHAFEDPTELTGRTAIWQAEIGFIRDHPLLGYGFGTFADTGFTSPLHNYVSDAWVQNESHGHNAYLQLLVTIGGVGFLLALLVLVLAPARALFRFDPQNTRSKSVLMAVFVFMVLHNFMESDFLEGDGPAWVAFLVVLASLREIERPHRAPSKVALP